MAKIPMSLLSCRNSRMHLDVVTALVEIFFHRRDSNAKTYVRIRTCIVTFILHHHY
jgi:hypothetical protein